MVRSTCLTNFEAVVRPAPVLGEHEGLLEAGDPLVALLGRLAGEVSETKDVT